VQFVLDILNAFSFKGVVMKKKNPEPAETFQKANKKKQANVTANSNLVQENRVPLEDGMEPPDVKKIIDKLGILLEDRDVNYDEIPDVDPEEFLKHLDNLQKNTIHKAGNARAIESRKSKLTEVNKQLSMLFAKRSEFRKKYQENFKLGNTKDTLKYKDAAIAVNIIYHQINKLSEQYVSDGKLADFVSASKKVLDNSNDNVKKLQEHRGCKAIIINILAIICSFGYAYYKGGLTLFNPPTDSAKKIEALYKSINTLAR